MFIFITLIEITKESIAKRTKLRRQRLNMVKEKVKNINNKLLHYYLSYLNPSIMLKRLRDVSDERNKDLKINQQNTNYNKKYC